MSLTRADIRAAVKAASTASPTVLTAAFWADLAERVLTSAAGGALAVVTAAPFALGEAASWEAVAVGAGTAALVSFLKGIAASASGTGSASLAPSV
ncbi:MULTISPECIES: holin [unclassified Microbacterium]|uniref:holin n=1 Tax=unclassified Microbacterium TaxID=2609290 RepID=UPI000567EE96|nr:holin [Microbacterium sp. B24]